jgi:hypothetical protein
MYLSELGITTYVFWNDAPKIRLMTHASCRSGILTYFASCAGAVPSKNSVVSVFSALWFARFAILFAKRSARRACRFREQLWLSPCSWLIRQACPMLGLLNEWLFCSWIG